MMKTFTKPPDHYVEITTHGNITISFQESRQLLDQIGVSAKFCIHPATRTTASRSCSMRLCVHGRSPTGGLFCRQSCGSRDLAPPARTRSYSSVSSPRPDKADGFERRYKMKPKGICDGVQWMGAVDWNRRLFDSLIPLTRRHQLQRLPCSRIGKNSSHRYG